MSTNINKVAFIYLFLSQSGTYECDFFAKELDVHALHLFYGGSKGVFTCENVPSCEFPTGMTFQLCLHEGMRFYSAFT